MAETPWQRLPTPARAGLGQLWGAWRDAEEAARSCPERKACACGLAAEAAARRWIEAALTAHAAAEKKESTDG